MNIIDRSSGWYTYDDAANLEAHIRAMRGAALLDRLEWGWFDTIRDDLKQLDIASETSCVLGLVYGDFGLGCTDLDLSERDARRYGFQEDNALRDNPVSFSYLQHAWEQVLIRRMESSR